MKNSKIYPWIVVALLWCVGLLNYLDRQILSTMQGSIAMDIKELQSAERFGFLMGVFLWIYGLMSPVAGLVADKLNRKWIIVTSLFVWSGVTYGMGYATTYNELFVLRAIMGVSEALYLPTALALIADYHQDKTRSLAIGIHMTGLYLGSALGGFGATFADHYSWHFTFHTFGLVGVVYAFVLVFLLKEKPERMLVGSVLNNNSSKKPPFFKAFAVLFTNVSFWIVLLYFSAPSLPGWATKNWLPTLFSKHLDMPMATAGPLSTVTLAAASFVGVICGGILSDKWVQRNIRGRIYTSAIGLGLMLVGLVFLGFGHSVFELMAAGICFGIGFGFFDANNMPILCQFVSSKYRATAYGIMNMTGVFFGAFITNLLGKSTDQGNLGRDFAMLGIAVAVALIIQLIFLKPTSEDFSDEATLEKSSH